MPHSRCLTLISGAAALVAALACGGDVADAPDAPEAMLDGLFAALETGCAASEPLNKLLDSMATSTDGGAAWTAGTAVQAPAAFAISFGAPSKIGGDDEYSRFSVPVTGATWLGLSVLRVERWVGHQNGISGMAVVLDATPEVAAAAVAAQLTVVDSCDGDADCITEPTKLTVQPADGGGSSLICDWSM